MKNKVTGNKSKVSDGWRNRIVGEGMEAPDQLKRCWTCNERKPSSDFSGALGKCCEACRLSGKPKWTKSKQEAARYRADRIKVLSRNKQWKEANALRYRSQQREYRMAQRLQKRDAVLSAYGGKCECCGEAEPLFLTIDHIHGNGAEHRRQIGKTDMWKWLYSQGFPAGYRILCFNCNAGRYRNGGKCPHEEKQQATVLA